ncbi:PrgI family protein [Brevibacillus sp. IT-7CA2]
MYGEQHLLTYKSGKESTFVNIGPIQLSFRQLLWWLGGGFVSFLLTSHIPPLPFVGYWGYLPHLIPFKIALAFSFLKHPSTDLPLGKYVSMWFQFWRRKKVYF